MNPRTVNLTTPVHKNLARANAGYPNARVQSVRASTSISLGRRGWLFARADYQNPTNDSNLAISATYLRTSILPKIIARVKKPLILGPCINTESCTTGDAEVSKRIFVLCRSTIVCTAVCTAEDCRMMGNLELQGLEVAAKQQAVGLALPFFGLEKQFPRRS